MMLKASPEDFRVIEVAPRAWDREGEFYVYLLTKRGCTTSDAIRTLVRQNNIAIKHIRFAGMKDKAAVTQQFITAPQALVCEDDRMSLEHVGFTDSHLYLGDLLGNRFEIVARMVKEVRDVSIPNYFGEQRFSTHNVELGLHVLRGEWKVLAEKLCDEFDSVKKVFADNPDSPVHAVRKAPFHILLLYVHSVQSMLFNQVVSAWVKEQCDDVVSCDSSFGPLHFPVQALPDLDVPMMGAAQALGGWEKYYAPLLAQLQLTPQNFLVRTIPGLTMEGTTRKLRCDIKDKSITQEGDVVTVKMFLPPGSYATVCCSGWLV